ncbi:hypothetical protein MMC12_004823 [Toensbergia leucococca]|nr:hypothetical protein [Toensbergia leucococca]
MNGENFYSRQNTVRAESPPPLSAQPTAPMVNGAPGADNLPAFATFDAKNRRLSDEDRIPLNSRTPSNRTAPSTRTALNSPDGVGPGSMDNGLDRYDMSGRGAPGGLRGGRGGRAYNGPRDEFGNPLPPSAAFGPMPPGAIRRDPSEPPRIRHQYSNETMSSQGSRGRGMGGYPPRGRSNGRGRPYGPNRGSYGPGRGGSYRPGQGGHGANGSLPMGAMVAGAGAGMMVGEMRDRDPQGPPSDYTNGYQPQGVQGSVMPGPYRRNMSPSPHAGPRGPPSALGYGRQPSPGPPSAPGYGRQPSPGPPSAPGYGRQPSPGPPSAPGYGRQPSPGPPSGSGGYGYAVRQQSPRVPDGQRFRSDSPPPPLPGVFRNETDGIGQAVEMDAFTGSPSQRPTFGANNQLRDSDSDVQGMVGLQQHRGASPLRQDSSAMTPSSVYSNQDSYIPPRAAWAGGPARNRTPPIITTHNAASSRNSPVELPTQQPNLSPRNQQKSPSHARINSADNYYEDVDPRFADPEPLPQSTNQVHSSLMPGHLHDQQQPYSRGTSPSHLNPSSSYDSIQEGARSPAASDGSQFTSVSQRGVNPDWRPPPNQVPGMGMGGVPNRRPVQQQRDVLSQNPDFEIPGLGRGSGRGARGGRIPGMIQGMGGGPPGGSRYPGADM